MKEEKIWEETINEAACCQGYKKRINHILGHWEWPSSRKSSDTLNWCNNNSQHSNNVHMIRLPSPKMEAK